MNISNSHNVVCSLNTTYWTIHIENQKDREPDTQTDSQNDRETPSCAHVWIGAWAKDIDVLGMGISFFLYRSLSSCSLSLSLSSPLYFTSEEVRSVCDCLQQISARLSEDSPLPSSPLHGQTVLQASHSEEQITQMLDALATDLLWVFFKVYFIIVIVNLTREFHLIFFLSFPCKFNSSKSKSFGLLYG